MALVRDDEVCASMRYTACECVRVCGCVPEQWHKIEKKIEVQENECTQPCQMLLKD